MKRITFKSIQDNFRKEMLGIKNNTIRKFEGDDLRRDILDDFKEGCINCLDIEIVHVDTKEMFVREVKDVTLWQGWYIITWKGE